MDLKFLYPQFFFKDSKFMFPAQKEGFGAFCVSISSQKLRVSSKNGVEYFSYWISSLYCWHVHSYLAKDFSRSPGKPIRGYWRRKGDKVPIEKSWTSLSRKKELKYNYRSFLRGDYFVADDGRWLCGA